MPFVGKYVQVKGICVAQQPGTPEGRNRTPLLPSVPVFAWLQRRAVRCKQLRDGRVGRQSGEGVLQATAHAGSQFAAIPFLSQPEGSRQMDRLEGMLQFDLLNVT
jgi:hypothetical protein